MKNRAELGIKNIIKNNPLTFLSVLFFVLSQPNFILKEGLGFFAFLFYIPLLICIHNSDFKTVWFHGLIFGIGSYGISGYWIIKSYPEFIPVIYAGYGILYTVVFLLLKVVDWIYKKNGWVVQWLLLCSFEYIKTLGFAGLSYGVTAYSQWKNIYFIQITDIIGVFGLNAVILLFSAIIYSFIQKYTDKKNYVTESENNLKEKNINLSKYIKNEKYIKLFSPVTTWIAFSIWIVIFAGIYIYGFLSVKNYSSYKTTKVVAVQNNENSWLDGIEVYTKNIQKLMSLTDDALELNPDIDLVVWPETSVVPAITANYYSPVDKRRADIINHLLNYIESKECEFIIGNGHQVIDSSGNKKLYNSALQFIPGVNVIPPEPSVYSKNKLVPFTEYFPYKRAFPWIYKLLRKKGLLSWEKGFENTVFNIGEMKASSLICFEDTFTNIARNQYNNGSRCFICISNDSWSKSIPCQNQHLAIALFRSIENRVPSVRSTASGTTCIIDPNGKLTAKAPEFCEAYIVAEIPVLQSNAKSTVYSKYGDYAAWIEIFAFVLLLIIQLINVIIKKDLDTTKV